ncbi:MAG: hypothetical protein D6729_17830 [Deltaproteobacteria bacterium]|nr:MAG: hypothetical protein D6729_17830 [Deltaproteobacteria bacterium]
MWIALVTVVYLVAVLLWHRVRLWRARRGGLPLDRFRPFDHRGVLDELRPLYEAGLPDPEAPRYTPEPAAAAQPFGEPVEWLSSAWASAAPERLPDPVAHALRALRRGEIEEAGAKVLPTQPREVDQALTSLGLHHFLEALYAGRISEAASVLAKLPAWTNRKISARVVDKHLAQLALAEAEASSGGRARRAARRARVHVLRAGGGEVFADPGTRGLWSHVLLRHFTHFLNLEWRHVQIDRGIRKSLAENRTSPILYYELAHCAAHRGKGEEAVDHLARALFYAKGDPFYVRAILETPEVGRLKPILAEQVRTQFGSGA